MPLNPALFDLARDWRRKLEETREANEKPMLEAWQEYGRRRAHDPLQRGHARVRAIYDVWARMDKYVNMATQEQSNIQFMTLCASARLVYEYTDYYTHELEILRVNNWFPEDMAFMYVISAPRRLGKTVGVARAVLAMALVLPDTVGAVFAPTQDQGWLFVKEVKGLLEKLAPHLDSPPTFREVKTDHELHIIVNGNLRKFKAMTSGINVRFPRSPSHFRRASLFSLARAGTSFRFVPPYSLA